jgi:hypothetical protein
VVDHTVVGHRFIYKRLMQSVWIIGTEDSEGYLYDPFLVQKQSELAVLGVGQNHVSQTTGCRLQRKALRFGDIAL